MKTKLYLSPLCEVIHIVQEAVLCSSPSATTEAFDDLGTLEME
jgi:hypothetical protein